MSDWMRTQYWYQAWQRRVALSRSLTGNYQDFSCRLAAIDQAEYVMALAEEMVKANANNQE